MFLEIMKVGMWVVIYFASIGMLAVFAASLVFMVGMMIMRRDITDMQSQSEKWNEEE